MTTKSMKSTSGQRLVHDVLFSKKLGNKPFLALVQWGSPDEGYDYEVICPWCATTVTRIEEAIEADGPMELGPKQLLEMATPHMETHRLTCTASGFSIAVVKTNTPLGTETKRRIM